VGHDKTVGGRKLKLLRRIHGCGSFSCDSGGGQPRWCCRMRWTKSATACPMAAALSSWMKCTPGTVISVWLGQVGHSSRSRAVMVAPGSALINSLGTVVDWASHVL